VEELDVGVDVRQQVDRRDAVEEIHGRARFAVQRYSTLVRVCLTSLRGGFGRLGPVSATGRHIWHIEPLQNALCQLVHAEHLEGKPFADAAKRGARDEYSRHVLRCARAVEVEVRGRHTMR
jgi:hypothetical protein